MTKYETMLVTSLNMEDAAREKIMKRIKTIIEADGNIEAVDEWGKRRLAYPINKEEEGIYTLIYFEAGAGVPAELTRRYNITEGVLRSNVIARPEGAELPELQQKPAQPEAPAAEVKAEEPKAEPAAEEAKAEEPAAEKPAEEPKAEEAKVEQPAEEVKAGEAKEEKPKAKKPAAKKPAAKKPKADEAPAEEAKAEEPEAKEEPKAEAEQEA